MSRKLRLYRDRKALTLLETFLSPNPEIVGAPEIANRKEFLVE